MQKIQKLWFALFAICAILAPGFRTPQALFAQEAKAGTEVIHVQYTGTEEDFEAVLAEFDKAAVTVIKGAHDDVTTPLWGSWDSSEMSPKELANWIKQQGTADLVGGCRVIRVSGWINTPWGRVEFMHFEIRICDE